MTRILLIACLAASSGIHLALAATHGVSFHFAAALLAGAAGALALRPGRFAAAGAAVLLAGLLAAYALEHGSAFDAVAAFTKTIEVVGLGAAVRLALARPGRRPERVATFALAAMIALFAAAATPATEHEHAPGTAPHGH